MDRKEKLAMLQALSEDRLRKDVLIPLFRAMKFKDVKDIKNTAIESIRGKLKKSNLDKLLRFIDGNKLIELLDKHMPNYFFKEIEYFNTYFNALKTDFERIKDISAIGQKEPVPLENIYVSLKLTETVKEREIPVDEDRKIVEDELIRKELASCTQIMHGKS
jgi:hypothetical protein